MTQKDHPLTSRVMVNRIWRGHFGRGIVPSVDNFGRLGEKPSNQPLLDWLALAIHRERLVDQVDASDDHAVEHIPDEQ